MPKLDLRLVDASPLRYLLSLPPDPAPAEEAWPVLCFLHGYDEGAPLEIRRALTRHGPLHPESAREATDRFIVVAPQLPTRGDLWHRYADNVREIVAKATEDHGGDSQRTYLTGFSFGGNGVFDLALAQPDRWAALWPVDPTRVPDKDPRRPVWLSFGEISRSRKEKFIRALNLKSQKTTPDGDRLCLDQGQDHTGSARLAYQDERIYTWLLSKRLPSSR